MKKQLTLFSFINKTKETTQANTNNAVGPDVGTGGELEAESFGGKEFYLFNSNLHSILLNFFIAPQCESSDPINSTCQPNYSDNVEKDLPTSKDRETGTNSGQQKRAGEVSTANSKKRKSHFNDILKKKYQFIVAVDKEEQTVRCNMCLSMFSVSSGGQTSITVHLSSDKHKRAEVAAAGNSQVNKFYRSIDVTAESLSLALTEGTYAYHNVRHNHSFRSMDCTNILMKKFYNKKFTCARTKSEAITCNVLYPWIMEDVRKELKATAFVSISFDTSNHNACKLLPIVARYYDPYDEQEAIKNKVLKVLSIPGETGEILSASIKETASEFEIGNKLLALSADNTNTNFGGLNRRGHLNVGFRMNVLMKRNLFHLGCNAHIIHNCAKNSFDVLPIDAEVIITKIFGYFHGYTVRTERFKEFCSFVEQEYNVILGHIHVRWLSLEPAIQRILLLFEPLKSFFLSEPSCPAILKRFFENDVSELWLTFIHGTSTFFCDTIRKIEGSDLNAVEVAVIVKEFQQKLQERRNESFLPYLTRSKLRVLIENGSVNEREFKARINNFYESALKYIDAWTNSNCDFSQFSCLLLKKIPSRREVDEAVQKLCTDCSILNLNPDDMFDEYTCIRTFLEEQEETFFTESAVQKWSTIFKHFKLNNVQHGNFKNVMSLIFSLPGTNAFIERCFSTINDFWTKNKSSLVLKTLEAVASVKINCNMKCDNFAEKLEKNKSILKKIHTSEKYI